MRLHCRIFCLIFLCACITSATYRIPSAAAVEIVFLRSGSSLLAEGHVDRGNLTEVILMAGAKVFIENFDIDRIQVEDSSPVQISDIQVDPEKLLPETTDPLNYWLDIQPGDDRLSKRLFLSFADQLEKGEECPLARSMMDVRLARKRRVPKIEFAEMILYLGMDLQYHEAPGITYEEAYKKLRGFEKVPNLEDVVEFIGEIRRSARDRRKEQVLADAISLRDRLEPMYERNSIQSDGDAARADRLRRGIRSLRE
jgi:hypothetical protein